MSAEPPSLLALLGERFYKMTGSGNDFVFVDARQTGVPAVVAAEQVVTVCARGTGVGADGLVLLDQPRPGGVRIAYYNSDGSRASLCGNATLCTARLAVHLGAVPPHAQFVIETDAGAFRAGVAPNSGPHFELAPVVELRTDVPEPLPEQGGGSDSRVGFAVAGVPHLVVRTANVDQVDLEARAPSLRRPTPGRPNGANVNYVSPDRAGRWRMRTFERGVEGETLACGTGAVACAALLHAWGEVGDRVELVTRSGQVLTVIVDGGAGCPWLGGEGRLVFVGSLTAEHFS